MKGGLGNQMFQYAAAKTLAAKYQSELYLDLSFLHGNKVSNNDFTARPFQLDIFNIKAIRNSKLTFKLKFVDHFYRKYFWPGHPINQYCETSVKFDHGWNNIVPPVRLSGYFQNEKYFKGCAKEVLADFTFNTIPEEIENQQTLDLIDRSEAVMVHVRRGDYVSKPSVNNFHGICGLNYYRKAVKYFVERLTEPKFFIFSDDPSWAKQNIGNIYPDISVIVSNNYQQADHWKDLFLMSRCRHHIIANSSFSWWAARLGQSSDQIVIAPEKWFATSDPAYDGMEIVPERWIKMNND